MNGRLFLLLACSILLSLHARAQTLTVGGGKTIRVAASKHDYATIEFGLPWRENIWGSGHWRLGLNQAISVSRFHDVNTVYLASWAPNLVLRWQDRNNLYYYVQAGFGVALLSDTYFESRDNDPRHTGTTDMGSHGQFESSLALGMTSGRFGLRAKLYHYSNAELAHPNDGIDVAELGLSYRF